MIGRGLWFAAGAAAGVYGSVKAKRVAESFTVEGVKHRAKGAALGARLFREELAHGKAEAEVELRARYEVAAAEKARAIAAGEAAHSSPAQIPPQEGTT